MKIIKAAGAVIIDNEGQILLTKDLIPKSLTNLIDGSSTEKKWKRKKVRKRPLLPPYCLILKGSMAKLINRAYLLKSY